MKKLKSIIAIFFLSITAFASAETEYEYLMKKYEASFRQIQIEKAKAEKQAQIERERAEKQAQIEKEKAEKQAQIEQEQRFLASIKDKNSLTEVVIPSGITTIGKDWFKDCKNLTSVTIPDSVRSVNSDAFSGCEKLKNFYISSIEAFLEMTFFWKPFAHHGGNLYLNGELVTDVTIPDNIIGIRFGFCGYTNLKSITIHSHMKYILLWAFEDCSSLTDIYFLGSKNQWKKIDFSGETKLKSGKIRVNGKWKPVNLHFAE